MLVAVLPPFRDIGRVGSVAEVYVVKKAQLCAAHFAKRFGTRAPTLFGFPDVAALTVMADNVLPAVLRAMGALVLVPVLASQVDGKVALPAGDVERQLRAATVVAGERIVTAVRGAATAELAAREARSAEAVATAGEAAADDSVAPAPPTTPAQAASRLSDAALTAMAALTEADVDEHLWLLGKRAGYRSLERHATKDTYLY